MSFSQEIKEELIKNISTARHCQIAELAAISHFSDRNFDENSHEQLFVIKSENEALARKCFTLLKKTFNMYYDYAWDDCPYNVTKQGYELRIDDLNDAEHISKAFSSPVLVKSTCCKRAYLRGAFLAIGSISNPEKSYHLEYSCQNMKDAEFIAKLLENFDIEAKIFERKGSCVVYIKDGTQIVETLNVMEAHIAMMELENMRILKEMRNSVNRQVNCETANINKTVSAAQKMIDEITFLMGTKEYEGLPKNLKEIAALRIEYPEASLTELGEFCDPKVGKSGVNHRLRKLSEMAAKAKGGEL